MSGLTGAPGEPCRARGGPLTLALTHPITNAEVLGRPGVRTPSYEVGLRLVGKGIEGEKEAFFFFVLPYNLWHGPGGPDLKGEVVELGSLGHGSVIALGALKFANWDHLRLLALFFSRFSTYFSSERPCRVHC